MRLADTQTTRALERRCGAPEELMARAGRALGVQVRDLARARAGAVVVACGKGNNGGDGLVAAAWLKRWGYPVSALLQGEPAPGSPAAWHLARLRCELQPQPLTGLAVAVRGAAVIVDALAGTGLQGPLRGDLALAAAAINSSGKDVVSCDLPSGVEADTGQAPGEAVRATLTVALSPLKPGLFLYPGRELAGRLSVADIGLEAVQQDGPDRLELADLAWARPRLPRRPADWHKGRGGLVTVIGGSRSMPGAPVLAGLGALRAGAGLVRLVVPAGVLGRVMLPPELMAVETDGTLEACLAAADGTVVVGPGAGSSPEAKALCLGVLAQYPGPVVADADALNAMAEAGGGRVGSSAGLRVLTPHPKEMARLCGLSVEAVQADRVGAARTLARKHGCTVVLKGAGTVTSGADGKAMVNLSGHPVLATAGSGDVLSGVVAAYLNLLPPTEAAALGAFIHGLAGEVLGSIRPWGATAGDIAQALPEALARIAGTGYA